MVLLTAGVLNIGFSILTASLEGADTSALSAPTTGAAGAVTVEGWEGAKDGSDGKAGRDMAGRLGIWKFSNGLKLSNGFWKLSSGFVKLGILEIVSWKADAVFSKKLCTGLAFTVSTA